MIGIAAEFLTGKRVRWPRTAIVLGSAQASFLDALEDRREIDYREIPGWPVPTVQGHGGKLITGWPAGREIIVLSGRVHLYEGRTPREVVFGVRALGLLGLKNLLLTNAAGGINPSYRPGLLVLISDHINLQGANPLVGPNDAQLGLRFPDMSTAYDRNLRIKAREAAEACRISLAEGVYAAVLGPSFETPAEIRYLRTIGADLAGMSTVLETIAARHMGIRVLGLSTVTNMAAGMQAELSHEEVLETGKAAAGDLRKLLEAVLERIDD